MAYRADVVNALFTGEDKNLSFTIYQAGTPAEDAAAGIGTPQNISGWALGYMVKKHRHDADSAAKIAKTTGAGSITIPTGTDGVCIVALSDDDTSLLRGGDLYHHELKRTDSGSETTLVFGSFVPQQSVIR